VAIRADVVDAPLIRTPDAFPIVAIAADTTGTDTTVTDTTTTIATAANKSISGEEPIDRRRTDYRFHDPFFVKCNTHTGFLFLLTHLCRGRELIFGFVFSFF